jgi:hypothetical protein
MAKTKEKIFEVTCPDCGAMLRIDAATGLMVSHTPAPRKRMFEDLETAAQAMRDQEERKESIFRQSVDAEKNKADLLEKKFAEAMRKAKDARPGLTALSHQSGRSFSVLSRGSPPRRANSGDTCYSVPTAR